MNLLKFTATEDKEAFLQELHEYVQNKAQQDTVNILNDMLRLDTVTVNSLFRTMPRCSAALAESKAEVNRLGDDYYVSLLGILNGLYDTSNRIVPVLNTQPFITPGGLSVTLPILGFTLVPRNKNVEETKNK